MTLGITWCLKDTAGGIVICCKIYCVSFVYFQSFSLHIYFSKKLLRMFFLNDSAVAWQDAHSMRMNSLTVTVPSLSLWDLRSSSFAVCHQPWFSVSCGASCFSVSHWMSFKLHPPSSPVLLWITFYCFPSLIQLKDVNRKKKNKQTHTLWCSPFFLWDLGSAVIPICIF